MENEQVKKQGRKTKGIKGKIVPLHTKRKEVEKVAPTVGAGLPEPKRKSGIDILGDAGWGTHFCLFYHTRQDLIDILVPYFKAGLENNEFCMWVTSEPLNAEDAEKSLKRAVKNLDGYIKKGQIEILDYSDWYTKTGEFEADKVLQGWVQKHDQAIKNGYDGLRLTGNTLWLEKKEWRKFTDYEAVVNSVIGKYKMLAVCTYSLERCGASEILDVEHNHQFSLIKWKGDWKILESSSSNQLEARLAEQTMISEALEHSKKEWVETFNAISDWVVLVDVGGRILRTNRIGEQFTGKPLDEIVGQVCCKLVHGSEKHIPGCPLLKMLETGQRESAELQVPNTDQWLMVTTDPVTDEEGEIIGAVHITRDITERKKAEEVLRESEDRYRDLFEAANDIILAVSAQGNIIDINRRGEELTDYTRQELLEKNVLQDLIIPQDREHIRGVIQNLMKGMRQVYDVRWRAKDGTILHFEGSSSARMTKEGKFLCTRCILRDITERRRAEQQIERLAKFPSENPNPVLRISSNGLILYNNKAALPLLKVWGCQRKDQLLSGRWYQYVADALGSGGNQQTEVKCGKRIFSLTFAPVVDSNYVNVYALDITERKRAEERLLEDKKQLRSLASELSLTEEHERRCIAEGLHDSIIQPLVFLDIKLDSLKKSAKQRGLIDSLDEMRTTIGELIEMTRGFIFDLSSSVVYELGLEAAIEEWLTANIREKYAISTIFEDDGQSKPLDDDMRAFLFKAVRELLINVVKHAGAGSVKVSVARDEDKIKICVEDDGAGFEYLKKKAGLSSSSGYGLFSICERLHYLGGSFDIESKLGHGTRVALTAPLKCDS